jgi:hypothetical protein
LATLPLDATARPSGLSTAPATTRHPFEALGAARTIHGLADLPDAPLIALDHLITADKDDGNRDGNQDHSRDHDDDDFVFAC